MSLTTLCLGLAGKHSLQTLGEGLRAFDRLLSELVERCAGDTAVDWIPFKINTDTYELWVQLDAVTAQESEAPVRIAQGYLDHGIALACGVRPDPAICQADADSRLLAASPAGASQLTLASCGVWLTLELFRDVGEDSAKVGATTLSADGILTEDLTEVDGSVAVVLPSARQAFRCVPGPDMLPSVANLVGKRVHLRGRVDPTQTEANVVWLAPLERFELSSHWAVNPAEEQMFSLFQARWSQSNDSGVQAVHGRD